MIHRQKYQAGFSAIELLITLFVAASFVAAGYQLYSIIIKNGGEARMETTANNIAYDMLRLYASDIPAMCDPDKIPNPPATIPAGSGLPANATPYVDYDCPYGTSSPISKVVVKITYGTPQTEVTHAIYASAY